MDQPQPIPPPATYEDLARIIDHTLLRPELTSTHIVEGLELAKRYRVAAVTVRQCDIDLAVRTLEGSSVKPAVVCAWPYGWQSTSAKLFEARDLLRRGAKEIETVVPTARLLSREFQYVASELSQLEEACRKEGAILKAGFESQFLPDELKIIACRCCESAEVDFVVARRTEDLPLLRKYLPDETHIKVETSDESLDAVLNARESGAGRWGTGATAALLDAWKARLVAVTAPAT